MVLPFASTKSKTLLVAFLAVSMAHQAAAAPLETNPVTPLGPVAPLDHQHPVFGGRPASDMVQAVVKADTTVTRAQLLAITNTTRRLEVSNSDVRNLEAHFQQSMEVNVETIQKKYASGEFKPSPWPSSYWPTYQDSINMKWSRSDASAAEKYAKAFGLDTQGFMDKISATTGVDSQASASRKCSSDSECSKFNDESRCGKRDGANTGYCIPTWYGLCHAWAPAAILEPEPKCSVVKNGVTFKVFDIKALLTQLYDGAGVNVVFTGARFDDADSVRDEYGRQATGSRSWFLPYRRDQHRVSLWSLVCRRRGEWRAGVEPARAFVLYQRADVHDARGAAMKYFNVPKYPFNSDVKQIAYADMTFNYINELTQDGPLVSTGLVDSVTASKRYIYLLELDANKNIIGGE